MGSCSLTSLAPPSFSFPALVFTLLPPYTHIRDLGELWLSMVPAAPRGEAWWLLSPPGVSTFGGSSRGEPLTAPDPGTEHVLAQRFILGGAPIYHGFCLEHGTSVCLYVVRGQSTTTLGPVRVYIHPTDIPGNMTLTSK